MSTKNYTCSQSELYQVAALAWENFNNHLGQFNSIRPIYDVSYYSSRLSELALAESLPDENARSGALQALHIQLVERGKQCLERWQLLKRYIATSFPKAELDSRYEEAGGDHYTLASRRSWDTLRKLMTMGEQFIGQHHVALLSNNNMPQSFQSDFIQLKNDFNTQYTGFLEAEEEARVMAQEKIDANNTLYKNMMSMLLDGQEIFRHDEARLAKFVLSDLLTLVSAPGAASMHGIVFDNSSQAPVAGAELKLIETGDVTIADADGLYNFPVLRSGNYTVKINAHGYHPGEFTVTVPIGTDTSRRFGLNAAV